MSTKEDRERINKYVESLELEKNVTPQEYRKGVEAAIRDRAKVFYFVRQVLKEKYPEIDADAVMREASVRFGQNKGKGFGKCKNAAEVMEKFSTKGGTLVFEQEFITLNEDRAEKVFHNCPHCEAFKELGCSEEEIDKLCKDMLMHGDYGVMQPHPVEMEFKKVISGGDDVCHMVLKTKK